jgi:hypothetical protein
MKSRAAFVPPCQAGIQREHRFLTRAVAGLLAEPLTGRSFLRCGSFRWMTEWRRQL